MKVHILAQKKGQTRYPFFKAMATRTKLDGLALDRILHGQSVVAKTGLWWDWGHWATV
jgi:hypothetical protein